MIEDLLQNNVLNNELFFNKFIEQVINNLNIQNLSVDEFIITAFSITDKEDLDKINIPELQEKGIEFFFHDINGDTLISMIGDTISDFYKILQENKIVNPNKSFAKKTLISKYFLSIFKTKYIDKIYKNFDNNKIYINIKNPLPDSTYIFKTDLNIFHEVFFRENDAIAKKMTFNELSQIPLIKDYSSFNRNFLFKENRYKMLGVTEKACVAVDNYRDKFIKENKSINIKPLTCNSYDKLSLPQVSYFTDNLNDFISVTYIPSVAEKSYVHFNINIIDQIIFLLKYDKDFKETINKDLLKKKLLNNYKKSNLFKRLHDINIDYYIDHISTLFEENQGRIYSNYYQSLTMLKNVSQNTSDLLFTGMHIFKTDIPNMSKLNFYGKLNHLDIDIENKIIPDLFIEYISDLYQFQFYLYSLNKRLNSEFKDGLNFKAKQLLKDFESRIIKIFLKFLQDINFSLSDIDDEILESLSDRLSIYILNLCPFNIKLKKRSKPVVLAKNSYMNLFSVDFIKLKQHKGVFYE